MGERAAGLTGGLIGSGWFGGWGEWRRNGQVDGGSDRAGCLDGGVVAMEARAGGHGETGSQCTDHTGHGDILISHPPLTQSLSSETPGCREVSAKSCF